MSKPLDPENARAIRAYTARLAEGCDLAGAVLFDSRARYSHHADRDADLAVLLRRPPRHVLDTKLAVADSALDVMSETGVQIQPMPIREDDQDANDRRRQPSPFADDMRRLRGGRSALPRARVQQRRFRGVMLPSRRASPRAVGRGREQGS
jgi:uncharacterized protein